MKITRNVRLVAVCLSLVAAACGGGSPSSSPTGPAGSGGPHGSSSPGGPGSSATPSGTHGGTISGTGPAATVSAPSQVSYDDGSSVGAMARTFLRSSPASRLVVEVDWVPGREPNQSALDHLSQVLSSVSAKPGGVSVRRGRAVASSKTTYSLDDLDALERRERSSHSAGNTATMWVVYVNGTFSESESVLGVAWTASSVAIFRDQLDAAVTAMVNEPAIERSVLTHEIGHLLALVNLGYRSRIAHEDTAHPNHSNNDRSVMFWAVDDLALKNLLAGGPPDSFDSADLADLKMLRES